MIRIFGPPRLLVSRMRRDATQRAMALALLFPEPKRGRHSELRNATGQDFDKSRLSRARAVLRHSAELARSGAAGRP